MLSLAVLVLQECGSFISDSVNYSVLTMMSGNYIVQLYWRMFLDEMRACSVSAGCWQLERTVVPQDRTRI